MIMISGIFRVLTDQHAEHADGFRGHLFPGRKRFPECPGSPDSRDRFFRPAGQPERFVEIPARLGNEERQVIQDNRVVWPELCFFR